MLLMNVYEPYILVLDEGPCKMDVLKWNKSIIMKVVIIIIIIIILIIIIIKWMITGKL